MSKPCSAAFLYHLDASSRSAGRPLPQRSPRQTHAWVICVWYTRNMHRISYVYIACAYLHTSNIIELNREAMFSFALYLGYPAFISHMSHRNRDAEVVHHRNVVLGFSTALLGSFQEPPACTSLADLSSLAFVVHFLIRMVGSRGHQIKRT